MRKILYKNHYAQSTIEFILSMIATVLLIIGMIRVFAWTGKELVARSQAHEETLLQSFNSEDCPNGQECPLRQLRTSFYRGTGLDAAVNSNIFGSQ